MFGQHQEVKQWLEMKMVQLLYGVQRKLLLFVNKKKSLIILDVVKAHNNDITKLAWYEEKAMLVTSSKEKSIKVNIYI